jgi:hypothetical protein
MRLDTTERQALEFLTRGPDTPGEVNSTEVMCAHLLYLDLVARGLASKDLGDDGPIYSITEAGRAALAAPSVH